MPRDKEKSSKAAVAAAQAAGPASKIPTPLRFPLLVLLSLTLSSLLYSFTAEYVAADLAGVSSTLDQWEMGGLVAWRIIELGIGWFGGYDGYDLAALSILSHGPPLYLLGIFYEVKPISLISSLVIDSLSSYIPFRLLRPLSPAHSAVPSDDIVTSASIQAYTAILAALIYSVTLFSAYTVYLPVYFVTYFANIHTIAAAHSASLITLFPISLVLGLGAKSFIFTPAAVVPSRGMVFNPETATLGETVWYNVWGYSKRTKTVITRTVTLMLVSGVNTFVQTFVTTEGVEARGALGYSAVWVVAGGVTGVALGIVGAV